MATATFRSNQNLFSGDYSVVPWTWENIPSQYLPAKKSTVNYTSVERVSKIFHFVGNFNEGP